MGIHEDKYNKGLVVFLDWHKAGGLFRLATPKRQSEGT